MIEYIALGAGAALAGYSIFIERTAITLTRIELGFKNLPRSFDGFAILQLSDLHIGHWWTLERRMEEIVNGLDFDLVALIGDITVSSRGAQLLKEFLARLPSGLEILAVYGNTEHKGRYGDRRRDDLNRHGIRMLTNEHVLIERGNQKIIVAGVDDPYTGLDDIDRALADAPEDAFKLLLAHAPNIADRASRAGVDLMLSGHTHGGQICFPLLGALYTHIPKYKKLVHGLFEDGKLARILGFDPGEMKIYVSRGIGISNLPMRFLCPPEIVHITLRSHT